MTEWKEYKLGDIAEVIGGGTPDTSNAEYWNGDIPWLTPKDLTGYNGIFISKGERYITKKGLDNSSAKLLPPGTVLLSSRAPIGYVAIASNSICTNQGFKSIICNPQIVDNLFMYYWIKNNVEYLQSLGTGTTFAEISGSVVKSINVVIPSLDTQRRIASILTSLDDKIDLLRRENATLEAMAETLFRQWFVVEAKEEWKEGKLGDIVDVKSGFAFKSSSFVDFGLYRLITIKAVQDGFLTLENADYISEIPDNIKDYCLLKEGDILLSLTGNVGRCCLVDRERLLLNQRVALLCAKDNKNWAFVYTLFRMQSMKSKLEEMAKGTAQPNLSPIELSNMQFEIPPTKLLEGFSDAATPLLKKALSNNKQIQALIETRDGLLPKLMSNEIKI